MGRFKQQRNKGRTRAGKGKTEKTFTRIDANGRGFLEGLSQQDLLLGSGWLENN